MKYIPMIVVKRILDKCYDANPEEFTVTMLPISSYLTHNISVLIKRTLDKDPYNLDWALNELKGVSYGDDTE